MEKVVVIWMWYVWFPLACAIAKSKKYELYWYEIDSNKIDSINAWKAPIDDEQAEKDITEVPFSATNDDTILDGADYIIVCVPTPIYDDHTPNLWPVMWACETIANHLTKWQNIIIESTINPGVCDEVVIPILEEKSWLAAGKDFEVAHCPERINPWDPKWNVYNINRNVWATSLEWTKRIADFYRSFLNADINEMKDIKHTEATKIIENTFRDINIAYVNELAKSFDILGLDIKEVIDGASNKPFAFMAHYPACWVGGHCIPVDPYYLIERARKAWFDHKFLSLSREINNSMPAYTVDKLLYALNEIEKPLKWTNVWLLGLSYKKGIADLRESPALDILKILQNNGANVEIYEPYNLEKSTSQSLEELLWKVDAIVIATNHDEFEDTINRELLEKNNVSVVIDGKNCLKTDEFKDSWIIYKWIGR